MENPSGLNIVEQDQRVKTWEHINLVQTLLMRAIQRLQNRGLIHDQSKLQPPESDILQAETPKLHALEYGSPEYMESMKRMKPYLDHHYARNQHHPEHWDDGIRDMSLLDLLEMLCDWKASSTRHATGNIMKSIEINQRRFNFSNELRQILENTVRELELT